MTPIPTRFLSAFFALLVLGLGVLAAFNYLVDPFGAYRPAATRGLEPFKDYDFRRLYAAELLRQNPCELVLIGSSRTYLGADPRWAVWGTDQAWNLGIPSAMMNEIAPIGRFALGRPTVRRIILFADFFAFNDTVRALKDFDRSRFSPRFTPASYHLRNLITIDATEQSLDILRTARTGKPVAAHVNGFKLRRYPARYPQQRADIQRSINYYLKSPSAFATFGSFAGSMTHLAELASACRARGVELTVVILPVHALHLETVRGAGLWETYERWTRGLAETLAGEGSVSGATPFNLWDFTAYRGAAVEPIPAKVGDAPAMAWFRDEAHPLPALVELVARRVSGEPVVDPDDGGPFGVVLTPGNVEGHLAILNRDREAFAAARPAEVKWVANLSAEAARWNAQQRGSAATPRP